MLDEQIKSLKYRINEAESYEIQVCIHLIILVFSAFIKNLNAQSVLFALVYQEKLMLTKFA